MTWWLRAHRIHLPVLAVVIGCAVAWLAEVRIAFEGAVASPFRAGVAVPLVLWWPVVVAGAVCASLSVDDGRPVRVTTVRSNGRLSAGLSAGTVVGTFVGFLPVLWAQGLSGLAPARDVAGLVGLALLLRCLVGAAAASAIVSAYFVAAALLGAGPDGSAAWWAWPVADLGPVDAATAFALLAAGLAVTARPGTRSVCVDPVGSA